MRLVTEASDPDLAAERLAERTKDRGRSLLQCAHDPKPYIVRVTMGSAAAYLGDGSLHADPDDPQVTHYSGTEVWGPLSLAHRACAALQQSAKSLGITIFIGIVSRGNARLHYEAT